jgi:Uma2 family endonuclease
MIAEIEMGHLATTHHQRAIKSLVFGLEKLYREGSIKYEPLPETDIDPGNPESKCPDLILSDNTNATVPVIIEVATNRGWRTDFSKMKRLIDETEYGIQEGFVFNFEKGEWHRYSKTVGTMEEGATSDILGIDLKSLML